jgi:5-dehydro-2-deoxygluconokinase
LELKDKKLDVICLGRAGIDLNPIEFNTTIDKVSGFVKSVGGSPANIAVGLAKQGMKVGFIGRVANNGFGKYIVDKFQELGINTDGIVYDNVHTNGLALTEVRSPSECGAIFYRENVADLHLCCEDIKEDYIKMAKVLMVSGTAFAKSPSREATFLAIEYARRNGVTVAMDIDYRPYSWESDAETSICYTMVCEKCDIIIGTREEFDAVEYLWDKENKDDEKTAKRFISKGTKLVVVKRGEEGSTAFTSEGEVIKAGIIPTKLRKTFGAGDAFAAGFLTSLLNENDVKTSLIKGSGTASIVISKTDCTEAMPTSEELKNYLEGKI